MHELVITMFVLSPPPSSPCGMCPRTHWDRTPGQVQSMKGHTSELAQPQFQLYYKLRSEFLRFRKFRLVFLSTRGVMLNSFTPCLRFVGCWQIVQIQIRLHITKVASDQVLRCWSLEIWIKKKNTKNKTPTVVMSSSKRLRWETPFDMYG